MNRVTAFMRSPIGRVLAVLVGMGVVTALIRQSGPAEVWAAVTRAPVFFLAVWALELATSGAETWGAILLYGDERKKVPGRELLRISLFCYALIGVVPFGRASGEAARATMMSRYVGVPLSVASAARMQAISLLGNTFISIPCALAVWVLMGPSLILAGIGAHFVLTGLLGGGLLLATRHSKLGSRLGTLFRRGQEWGPAVDEAMQRQHNLWTPMVWICLARLIRIVQRLALLAAVGAAVGVLPAFGVESINLVASMIGDVIPSQVGVTEAGYALAADALRLTKSDAVAMALLVHVAQIIWVGIGFLSPLLATSAPAPTPSSTE